MEEQERIRGLIAEQAKLLNHIKGLLHKIKEQVGSLENTIEQKPMCMSSSCCRNLNDTNSQAP